VDFASLVEESGAGTEIVRTKALFSALLRELGVAADSVQGRLLWEVINDSQSVTWQNVSSDPGTTWQVIATADNPGWQIIKTQP
jgi:hypothetical protein